MGNEKGEWIMRGVEENDPLCIKTVEQLEDCVSQVGFLPLFANSVKGFSVEERTVSDFWWSGNEERDPWEWRRLAAARGKVAYGKFFEKKAGFISLEWLPYFANYRRDGYDFDAKWDDGKASWRQKRIMDCFETKDELFSYEIKSAAGFGGNGEKNFEGTVSELQMQTYLVAADFRRKLNKKGEPYGWAVAVYAKPETLWGYDLMTSAYGEAPEESRTRIFEHMKKLYPAAGEPQLKKVLK